MKNIIFIIIGCSLLTSCLRLDDNLFNEDNKITEYKLDNYTGEQDFVLDANYKIQDSLIHIFTLNSIASGESSHTSIYAIYIGDISKIATDTVIMYCHGNKWHMDYYWQRAKLLAHTGGKNNVGVLMIDYRGYGLSNGVSTENSLYADVDAALNWLKGSGLTNDRLVMYGFSLGTAPATQLTANSRSMTPAKLVLEAPFASAAVMVQDASVLAMPSSFVTNLKINNAEEIKKVNQPFMWLHGTLDMTNNIKTHGQLVYDNYAGSYKESQIVNGAEHGNLPILIGYQQYTGKLYSFLKH